MDKQELSKNKQVERQTSEPERKQDAKTAPQQIRIAANAAQILENTHGQLVWRLQPKEILALAETIGNDRLLALLRGGGNRPDLRPFLRPKPAEDPDPVNSIQTSAPELYEMPAIRPAAPLAAMSPEAVRERE